MHRVRAATVGFALGLGLIVAGPASAAEQQEQPSARELDQRIRRLENIVESGQIAELIQRISTLEEEMRQLRGAIETQGHRLDELRKRQRNLYGDLDRRLRALEIAAQSDDNGGGGAGTGGGSSDSAGADGSASAGGSGASASSGSASASGGSASGGSSGSGASGGSASGGSSGSSASGNGAEDSGGQAVDRQAERNAYDAAFNLLKNGRYKEAAEAFRKFVEKYPDGPYADNAQYWLGESRYVTRDFEAALAAFRGVTEQFPDSAKVPDARLKIGYTLYELQQLDEARSALQKVIEQHPGSAVARLAEERLLKIKREAQAAQ